MEGKMVFKLYLIIVNDVNQQAALQLYCLIIYLLLLEKNANLSCGWLLLYICLTYNMTQNVRFSALSVFLVLTISLSPVQTIYL